MRTALAWSLALFLTAAAGLSFVALASDSRSSGQEAENPKPEPLVMRTYNVVDLICPIPDCPIEWQHREGGFCGTCTDGSDSPACDGVRLRPSSPLGSSDGCMHTVDLPLIIREMINAMSDREVAVWAEEGGSAVMQYFNGQLIISQTRHAQDKIGELLALMRAGLTAVTVEARWVILDDVQVAKIIPEDSAKRTVPQEVTEAALKDAGAKVVYRGQITCCDGQTVHLATGRNQALVVETTPVVSEHAAAYAPTAGTAFWGAALEVQPVLAANGKSAQVRVYSAVTEPATIHKAVLEVHNTADPKAPGSRTDLDLPEYYLHTFETSLRLPLGKCILVGGATAPKTADGKVMYLLLQVTASKPEAAAAK
jgi:hypothetical protein